MDERRITQIIGDFTFDSQLHNNYSVYEAYTYFIDIDQLLILIMRSWDAAVIHQLAYIHLYKRMLKSGKISQ